MAGNRIVHQVVFHACGRAPERDADLLSVERMGFDRRGAGIQHVASSFVGLHAHFLIAASPAHAISKRLTVTTGCHTPGW
jgi:hypothetical protein